MPRADRCLRKSRAVNWDPLFGAEGQLLRPQLVAGHGGLGAAGGLGGAGAQVEPPAGDLAGAAVDDHVQVDPAVLGGPDLGHVHVPQLVGAGDPKEPGPAAAVAVAGWLQQLAPA